jgi:hypothetical protein
MAAVPPVLAAMRLPSWPSSALPSGVGILAKLAALEANRVSECTPVNERRLGFSTTTRNPEGILSHDNRKS